MGGDIWHRSVTDIEVAKRRGPAVEPVELKPWTVNDQARWMPLVGLDVQKRGYPLWRRLERPSFGGAGSRQDMALFQLLRLLFIYCNTPCDGGWIAEISSVYGLMSNLGSVQVGCFQGRWVRRVDKRWRRVWRCSTRRRCLLREASRARRRCWACSSRWRKSPSGACELNAGSPMGGRSRSCSRQRDLKARFRTRRSRRRVFWRFAGPVGLPGSGVGSGTGDGLGWSSLSSSRSKPAAVRAAATPPAMINGMGMAMEKLRGGGISEQAMVVVIDA